MSTRVIHLGCTIDIAIMKANLPIGKRNRAIQRIQGSLFTKFLATPRPIGRTPQFSESLLSSHSHWPLVSLLHLQPSTSRDSLLHFRPSLGPHYYCSPQRLMTDFSYLGSCSIPIQTIDARQTFRIAMDVSGIKGIGGVFGKLGFATRVPRSHRKKHINWKKMYTIYYALLL